MSEISIGRRKHKYLSHSVRKYTFWQCSQESDRPALCAVWSKPLLGTDWIAKDAVSSCRQWRLIRLHSCAGWFEPSCTSECTFFLHCGFVFQGPVVQSIVSLTSLLMTNLLTVVAKVFSNTLIFLLQNCEQLLQCKISVYLPYFKIEILMLH